MFWHNVLLGIEVIGGVVSLFLFFGFAFISLDVLGSRKPRPRTLTYITIFGLTLGVLGALVAATFSAGIMWTDPGPSGDGKFFAPLGAAMVLAGCVLVGLIGSTLHYPLFRKYIDQD